MRSGCTRIFRTRNKRAASTASLRRRNETMSTKKRKRGVVDKHAFDVRVTPHPDAEQGQLPLTKNDSIPMTIQTCDSSNTDPITEPLAQPVADQTLTTDDAPRVVQTDTAKNAVAL